MHSGGDATGDSTPDRRAEPAATKCSTDRLPGAAPLGAICPARALRHLTPLLDLLRLRCKRLRRSQPSRQFWYRAHRLRLATCSRLRHRPHRPGRKPRTAPLPRSITQKRAPRRMPGVRDRPPTRTTSGNGDGCSHGQAFRRIVEGSPPPLLMTAQLTHCTLLWAHAQMSER